MELKKVIGIRTSPTEIRYAIVEKQTDDSLYFANQNDIKPQNILIGDNGEYVLSDYGITCHSPTHSSVSPRSLYLPHAAAESIQENRYDARTDIYQLGLTAFRLINGISTIKDFFMRDRAAFGQAILDGKIISESSFQPYVPHRLNYYDIIAGSRDNTVFNALKESIASHRVTRVTEYCCVVKNQREITKAAQKFFLSILE
jgi:serine/threonine protein kinase